MNLTGNLKVKNMRKKQYPGITRLCQSHEAQLWPGYPTPNVLMLIACQPVPSSMHVVN